MSGVGQVISPAEQLRAEELLEVEGIGQAIDPAEQLRADEIQEVSGELGVVGAVASVGLKAAMPSISKGLTGIIAGKGAREARKGRAGAQAQLAALQKIAKALVDGTDELMTLIAQGQRVDSFQVAETDIAHQQAMNAWSTVAASYAQLAGDEDLGQLPATETIERMFLRGGLGQPARTGAERLRLRRAPVSPYYQKTPLRTGAQRLRAMRALLGQVPATETVERMFLRGYGIDLGRSRAQKQAARHGWLKAVQDEFMADMRKANSNLNALARATGVTRATPGEAREAVDRPIERPPAEPPPPAVAVIAPPPYAPTARPPMPAIVQSAPPGAPPGWFPKPAIPVWVWPAGAGVLALLGLGAFIVLRKPA